MNRKTKYILNPEIVIIPNKTRNVLFRIDSFFHSPDKICPISPFDSIFLLLFDGNRTVDEVERDFLLIFGNNHKSFNVAKAIGKIKSWIRIDDLLIDSETLTQEERIKYSDRVDPSSLLIGKNVFDMKNGDLRLDAPLSLNFNVTTSCRFGCEYCYHPLDEISEFIPLQRLKEVLLQFKENGCQSVMLTGGDPMLRPDIDEIMEYLHKIGLFYSLSTKSILSEERIDKLINNAGLDRIQISLDSNHAEIVEKIIHAPLGYFGSCVKMIKYMISRGIDVRLKSVLTSYNADYVEQYFDFVASLGVKHVQLVGYGRSGARHKDVLFPSCEQMKKASEIIAKAKKKYPNMTIVGGGYSPQFANPVENCTNMFEKRSVCNAGRFAVTMLPNGEVTVCEQLPYNEKYIIGDLSKEDLMQWWNGQRLKNWLSPPKREEFAPGIPCYDCPEDDYNICHRKYSRCLRYCREYFGVTEMPDVRCPKARFEEFRIG